MKCIFAMIICGFPAAALLGEESLKDKLQARAAQFNAPAEIRDTMQRHLDELVESGIYDRALKVGDKAPDFTLNDHLGKPQSLSSYLKAGPVVLTWYRGGW